MNPLTAAIAMIVLALYTTPERPIVPYQPACTVYTGTVAGCDPKCSCRLPGDL